MSTVDSPRLAGIQEGGKDNHFIDFNLGCYRVPLLSHTVVRSLPNAALAFAMQLSISASMWTQRYSVLPR
jgi:hypothetical protein